MKRLPQSMKRFNFKKYIMFDMSNVFSFGMTGRNFPLQHGREDALQHGRCPIKILLN